jgi:hypothetical protein
MTDVDVKSLRELASKATPGPWRKDHTGFGGCPIVVDETHGLIAKCDGIIRMHEDAAFIAATCPNTVIALLDQLQAMTAARDEALEGWEGWVVDNKVPPGTMSEQRGRIAALRRPPPSSTDVGGNMTISGPAAAFAEALAAELDKRAEEIERLAIELRYQPDVPRILTLREVAEACRRAIR